MHNQTKKTISLVWIVMFVFLAACSKQGSGIAETTKPSATNDNATNSNDSPSPSKEERPLYTIKYMYPGGTSKFKKSDETEVGKIIKEKFNIVFEMVPYAGDWGEKVNLMLAAGDYPEILPIQYNENVSKYIQAGAAIALDDYLAKAPDFTERYKNQIPYWRALAADNKLYKWETSQSDLNTNIRGLDVAVRIDALEKQGWPKLVSEDDYVKFLKQAMIDFPETDGKKTIGMSTLFGEPWGMAGVAGIMYEKGGRYTGVAGNGGVIWNHAEQKFEDYLKNEYVLESYKFLNRLYREGILDKESFTDRSAQVQEKANSGRALSIWYGVWMTDSANKTLEKAGHPERQYITLPIRSKTQMERNEKRLIMELDLAPFNSVVITTKAKDPKRIMELVNWATSEEGQLLLQNGIEGKHYTVENGKRVPTDLLIKHMDNPAESLEGIGAFGFLGNDARAAKNGQPYSLEADPELRDKLALTEKTKEAYTKLGWKNSVDYWQQTSVGAPSGIIPSIQIDPSSDLGQLQQKMVEHRVKNTANLIMAKDDADFQRKWESVLKEYENMNPQSVVDKYNQMYKEMIDKVKK